MTEMSWWQAGVIYQIYPRSFGDASGDGVGDLPGITSRLGHLAQLGVDALWLSPIYPSPMADFGYDVSDHTDVHPLFGSLADFDALVARARSHGLRVILDYVPNHTSESHPWFTESRSSRTDPRRDWYLWRDPAPDGGPPTNWRSLFGGSAWAADPRTGQSYYHAFLAAQPDLNWRVPAVRDAMLGVLRYWLARGVDGFRVDALRQLAKDPEWRENPPNPAWRPGDADYERLLPLYSSDQPEVHAYVRAMREVLEEPRDGRDRVLIGELWLPFERLMAYYGERGDGLHLPANFHLIHAEWDAEAIAALVEAYEALLPDGAWPNWVIGNHDRSRVATRLGPAQARVAAMALLTLRGTPTLYYGDELGMRDVPVPVDRIQDPVGASVPGLESGRDPVRAPMPWNTGPNAGFCPPEAEPWLPLDAGAAALSVEAQAADPRSMLALHRRLLALRRAEPALHAGAYEGLGGEGGVLRYLRVHGTRRLLVALNFGREPGAVRLARGGGRLLLSSLLDREEEAVAGELRLRGDEGVVVALGS